MLFFKNHAENETGRPLPDLFFFFQKAFYEIKSSGLQLNFNIFGQASTWHTVKTNCIKLQTVDLEINSIIIF